MTSDDDNSAIVQTHLWFVCVFVLVLLTPLSVEAQRGGVTLTGAVNETVALSIAANSSHSDVDVDLVNSGSTVRMTISSTGLESRVIRVHLLVRSNIGFNISGILESKAVLVTQLSVKDVRVTGRLVSAEAIDNVEIPYEFDMRGRKDKDSSEKQSSILEVSQPFLLLSGPRISVGGTCESPGNALQISVLIHLKPQATENWRVQLTFFTTKRARPGADIDEMDRDAALNFATNALSNTAQFWIQRSNDQKQRFQRVLFPKGLIFDGESCRTAETCLAFSYVQTISSGDSSLASRTGIEPVLPP